MSDAGEESKKIKVVDRRRFDDSGELRPDRPPTVAKPAAPRAPEKPGQVAPQSTARDASQVARGKERGKPGTAAASPLFLDLVAGLAQQAEILITGAQGLPAQPSEAQRLIEYLAMLESKTTGNLSAEEAQILSNVIFQLRALYVQQQR